MQTNFQKRDRYGMYARGNGGPGPALMGADTLLGNDVCNREGEALGDIKELMIDMASGRVAYAVLSFGGVFGLGEKLFAVPWSALSLDTVNQRFTLGVPKSLLRDAPGFDKGHWPDMADPSWERVLHAFYGVSVPGG
ncbi:PRC-barrel domain-containing protein [Rubrivivax gelatinosus]|uniref:PRC-barrel domain protein n=1 Tax=Rubrivivax gelatinosus TaxID=28068 RepID=A0A4R2M6Q1_RUBGE|nr:PRC-barrel domain-containing protein [Rubrivivax gelatinosus]MBK1687921.1 photosystem reaction center subunit H [Rubrivivax gelatinosus]TCP01771.1 PRC-barrel domain protein [Rubrivivax gelatinosus]